jgi:hypothetical protein
MADNEQEAPVVAPKQETPKGLEIPVPKRSDVMDAFKKLLRPKPRG